MLADWGIRYYIEWDFTEWNYKIAVQFEFELEMEKNFTQFRWDCVADS